MAGGPEKRKNNPFEMQPGEISPINSSSSMKASCVSNNQPRRQLGVCPTTGLDDSLVYVQKQASTTAWCGRGILPLSTTVWYETGIPSRRQLGVYLTTGLDDILSLMMPLNVNVPYACMCLPKVTALIGNLYRKPSSEYRLLVQGRRVDPSWIFLA